MPRIIPIKELKNTSAISEMCHESTEPIYITKNGYGDMVIMSVKMYEEKLYMLDVYNKLAAAEVQIAKGNVLNGDTSIKSIREKYNVWACNERNCLLVHHATCEIYLLAN